MNYNISQQFVVKRVQYGHCKFSIYVEKYLSS